MKIVLQRVTRASVSVAGEVTGAIGSGLVLLLGFAPGDTSEVLRAAAAKIAALRVFADDGSSFSKSLLDIGGGVLLVPQFTLFGRTDKGRRPDFTGAMPPGEARELFAHAAEIFLAAGIREVGTGVFGAEMLVSLDNHGPVTLVMEF